MMKIVINVSQKCVLVLPHHFIVRHKTGNPQAYAWRSQMVSIWGTLKIALGLKLLCLLSVCWCSASSPGVWSKNECFISTKKQQKRTRRTLHLLTVFFQGQMMIIYHFLYLDTLIEGTSIFYYFFQQCHCFESISVCIVAGWPLNPPSVS